MSVGLLALVVTSATAPPPILSQTGSSPHPEAGIQAVGSQATTRSPLMTEEEYQARLRETYGAVLHAGGGVVPPPRIIFADEEEVMKWQAGVATGRATFGKFTVELQAPAMQALLDARDDMRKLNLDISPYARDAARRSYADTLQLWKKRVDAGLYHWYKNGRLGRSELRRIRALAPQEQAIEIFRLEAQGLFFSTNLKKTILSSAAPPGASQHLSMLAFDVKQHEQAKVRAALARHGWFQTVAGDFTHFTYLGCQEKDLPSLGLQKVTIDKRLYWVPGRTATL